MERSRLREKNLIDYQYKFLIASICTETYETAVAPAKTQWVFCEEKRRTVKHKPNFY